MCEYTEANAGVVSKRAEIISYEFEEKMLKEGLLVEDSPDKQSYTVLFLLGIKLML